MRLITAWSAYYAQMHNFKMAKRLMILNVVIECLKWTLLIGVPLGLFMWYWPVPK